jgi:hypothetical protein
MFVTSTVLVHRLLEITVMILLLFHYYSSLLLEDHINFSLFFTPHTIVHTLNEKKRADKTHGDSAAFLVYFL